MNRDKVTFYKWPIKENKKDFDSVKDNLEYHTTSNIHASLFIVF